MRIQLIVDDKLLRALNRAARRQKTSRSAFVRDVLREHLRIKDLEDRDRKGYEKFPQTEDEIGWLERAAVWPAEITSNVAVDLSCGSNHIAIRRARRSAHRRLSFNRKRPAPRPASDSLSGN